MMKEKGATIRFVYGIFFAVFSVIVERFTKISYKRSSSNNCNYEKYYVIYKNCGCFAACEWVSVESEHSFKNCQEYGSFWESE